MSDFLILHNGIHSLPLVIQRIVESLIGIIQPGNCTKCHLELPCLIVNNELTNGSETYCKGCLYSVRVCHRHRCYQRTIIGSGICTPHLCKIFHNEYGHCLHVLGNECDQS